MPVTIGLVFCPLQLFITMILTQARQPRRRLSWLVQTELRAAAELIFQALRSEAATPINALVLGTSASRSTEIVRSDQSTALSVTNKVPPKWSADLGLIGLNCERCIFILFNSQFVFNLLDRVR
jgi:hypothetical protein